MVPAFTGLGAPYWDPDARGGMFGLTKNTGVAEIVRATLEAVCYQTKDLMQAMASSGQQPVCLRVDGGMVNNSWVMQFLADILNIKVQRPVVTETTALGAAMLAGLSLGWHQSVDGMHNHWRLEHEFKTNMEAFERNALLEDWHKAVSRVRTN